METRTRRNQLVKVSWSYVWLLLIFACTPKPQEPYTLIWSKGKPVSVSVDANLAASISIQLKDSEYPVLGDVIIQGGRHYFTPVIPFQRGLTYNVMSGSKLVLSFTVPADTTRSVPIVRNSYPSCDTVPANLLKIYVSFSEPMMEGRSSQYLQLYNNSSGDTVKNAFLDLQPELWNEDGTVLTLWLDPGRIKQDLIPNKNLGTVLNENQTYLLKVSKGWKSKQGAATTNDFERIFRTTKRDVFRPVLKSWKITATRDSIVVNLNETLDWSLLNTTITVQSGDKTIGTKTISGNCERQFILIPDKQLSAGSYSLNVEGRLEDLAGNNLNRLFETDVTDNKSTSQSKDVHTISFRID